MNGSTLIILYGIGVCIAYLGLLSEWWKEEWEIDIAGKDAPKWSKPFLLWYVALLWPKLVLSMFSQEESE